MTKELAVFFTPLEWHIRDLTDSVYQCFNNPTSIVFTPHFDDIRANKFDIPPTIERWKKILSDCLTQPVEFLNFIISDSKIKCQFKFLYEVQQITLFTCNLLDNKETVTLSTRLSNLHFAYDTTPNILYFHVFPHHIEFHWNSSRGFYAQPNGLEFRHFLRDFPPPNFDPYQCLDQNTTSDTPVQTSHQSVAVLQPMSQTTSVPVYSSRPTTSTPTLTTSSGISPGMFYGFSNPAEQTLEARLYPVALNNIKLLRDELTVNFDPVKLAARFNNVKTPTNQDLSQLILAVTGCIKPVLTNPTAKESTVDSDIPPVDIDISNDNAEESSDGKQTT